MANTDHLVKTFLNALRQQPKDRNPTIYVVPEGYPVTDSRECTEAELERALRCTLAQHGAVTGSTP